MKKMRVILFFVGMLFVVPLSQQALAEGKADSGFALSLTTGGSYGFIVNEPSQTHRMQPWGFNLELIPSYRFSFISIDLGLVYDFLQKEFIARPGVRFHMGWFYIRVAIPFSILLEAASGNPYDLGVMLGAGAQIRFGKFSLTLEANVTPFLLELNNRGLQMPLEIRLGAGYHF